MVITKCYPYCNIKERLKIPFIHMINIIRSIVDSIFSSIIHSFNSKWIMYCTQMCNVNFIGIVLLKIGISRRPSDPILILKELL